MVSVRVTDGPASGTRRMVTLAAEVVLSLATVNVASKKSPPEAPSAKYA